MIVHSTPGLLDIRSITTMGLSAKPNSDNPIGMFGTGLKYAIAVLVRHGARPVVWIGKDHYEFFSIEDGFRGKPYQHLTMRLQKFTLTRARNTPLPFTTEYGRNWKVWMAFRELESNTRDEGGITTREAPGYAFAGVEGMTTIIVDFADYEEAWANRDDVFLPGGLSVRQQSEGMQVLDGESSRLYYRGLRAMDLSKPTLRTYNILAGIELTEDRTFKYEFQVKDVLARHIMQSDDDDLIRAVLKADDKHWEHELPFPQYATPGPAFHRVMADRQAGTYSRASLGYYARHDPRPLPPSDTVWQTHPTPWVLDVDTIVDNNGVIAVKQVNGGGAVLGEPYGYEGRWSAVAWAVLARLGMPVPAPDGVGPADGAPDPSDAAAPEPAEMTEEEALAHMDVEDELDPTGEERAAHDAAVAEDNAAMAIRSGDMDEEEGR